MVTEQETLIKVIGDSVRSGRSPLDAMKLYCQLFPEAEVRAALKEFEKRTGRQRMLREPASLERIGLPAWYPGPSEDDRYWPALREHLLQRDWSQDAVQSIDDASTKVVSFLAPPGLGEFRTRGLVLGYVQSGKTANFSAVIAKAADVGYKFFLVLSGVTNSLRSQTQQRLDSELVDLNRQNWHALTTVTHDFRKGFAGRPDAFLTEIHQPRVLCVVKKNKTILERLRKWLRDANKNVLANCPMLIIDDEADQASINTSGDPSKRTEINKLVLEIIETLPKVAYVGYTATPFANVFIDPTIPEDLLPRDFIVDLPRPANYFGTERIFGRERLTLDEPEEEFDGLDMIRLMDDDEAVRLRPSGQNNRSAFQPELTPSLTTALRYFWLATAARAARGQADEHSTMLVHTSLYTDVHDPFRPLIRGYLETTKAQVTARDGQLLDELKVLWETEQALVPSEEMGESLTSFEELVPYLDGVLECCEVVIENSKSVQRLAFEEKGRIQIVIGGNTLSRGLTLEGLVVSLFVRASTAYDTLLQMGRWFGYRKGYADLPRIWMTPELKEYFSHLAMVEQEIRNDIKRYELEKKTPLELAVRVQTHPALMITSKAKMQAAIPCDVSYAGKRPQTTFFSHKDHSSLAANRQAADRLIHDIRARGIGGEKVKSGSHLFQDIPVSLILSFLKGYQFHPNNLELRYDLLAGYIEAQNREGALQKWNVALAGRSVVPGAPSIVMDQDLEVPLLVRSKVEIGKDDYAYLKAIMSKVDRVMDDNTITSSEAQKLTDEQLASRRKRDHNGLLLLYPIAKDSHPKEGTRPGDRRPLGAFDHLIGVALVFPVTDSLTPQGYMSANLSSIERDEPDLPDEEEEIA